MNVKTILALYFGLDNAKVTKLNGYENENYLVLSSGHKFILKTYLYSESLFNLVKAEREILLQFEDNSKYKSPKPVSSNKGRFELKLKIGNRHYIVRLLTYVEGESIGFIEAKTELYESFGIFLAEMDLALSKINSSVIRQRKSEWNIVHFNLNGKLLKYIDNADEKELLKEVFDDFNDKIKPRLLSLRHSIIHNDANDFNVMVNEGRVDGIIDFGDLAYAPLINELAVAIAYAGFGKANPLKWTKILIKSYNKIIPLHDGELEILPYLVTARLATSILNANYSRITNPDNQYAYTSEKSAWKLLKWWIKGFIYTKLSMK